MTNGMNFFPGLEAVLMPTLARALRNIPLFPEVTVVVVVRGVSSPRFSFLELRSSVEDEGGGRDWESPPDGSSPPSESTE